MPHTSPPDAIIAPAEAAHDPLLAPIAADNWIGLWTLYLKEVRRFWKVGTQTIAAPLVTALLFLAIFTLALGREVQMVPGIAFGTFIAPGLVMMQMVQNAFANTSSSIIIAKVQGNIVDVLMPPLSPVELAVGYIAGGVTRGLMVGAVTTLVMMAIVDLPITNIAMILFHAAMACFMLSAIGLLGGIWAEKFDHIAAVTNFVVVPLSFLSGTFYSTERLSEPWRIVAHLNPFFYQIDGFRYGFIGQADGSILVGILVMLAANAALFWLVVRCFARGYKLKT